MSTHRWRETDSNRWSLAEKKKASSGSSTPRVRLGPQGDKGPSHAPFYESRNITSPQRRTLGSPAGRLCKIIDIFRDGTYGVPHRLSQARSQCRDDQAHGGSCDLTMRPTDWGTPIAENPKLTWMPPAK